MSASSLGETLSRLEARDWDGAHRLVQDIDSADAAWIHAHLHRVEGDLGNAAYWYRRAGRPVATGDLDDKRAQIIEALGS